MGTWAFLALWKYHVLGTNVSQANIWPTKVHNLANKPMPIFFPSHTLFGNPT
jgi:hypothetical protein